MNLEDVAKALLEGEATPIPGPQGPKGDRGETGSPGFGGVEGSPGPRGPQGDTGNQGPAGQDGQDGKDGSDGKPGAKGERGLRGEKGATGDRGPEGRDGPTGPRGIPGPRGSGGNLGGGSAGGGAPSGAAGGDLSGTYPNPSVVNDSHSHTGATVPAGGSATVSDADPGAVGAGGLWLQTDAAGGGPEYVRLWVRNDADDGWLAVGPISNLDGDVQIIAGPSDSIEIVLDEDGDEIGLTGAASINLAATKVRLATGARELRWGSADPGAGAGLAAPVGSLYLRQTAVDGVGSLWVKVGDADTEWTQPALTDTSLASYLAAGVISLTSANDENVALSAGAGGDVSITANTILLTGIVAIDGTASLEGDPVDTVPARDAAIADAIATSQPLDSDLTSIAALTTTSFGRGLLTTADLAALVTALKPYFLEPD